MESMIMCDFAFSNRLFHVAGNMGEITVKPEQKPEHLAELGKWGF